MSSIQAALDEASAALEAVTWPTALGENVLVDETPGRKFTLDERTSNIVLHVFGGGSDFALMNKAGVLMQEPTFWLCAMHYIGFDEANALRKERIVSAEAVADAAMAAIKNAMIASERFVFQQIAKPERMSAEQIAIGDFVTHYGFVLKDRVAIP